MQQYFVDTLDRENKKVVFNKEQAHHISHVLRMREGEVVRVSDQKCAYLAKIQYDGGDVFGVLEEEIGTNECDIKVTLLQALIKKDKWEWILQKATELGVSVIVPMETSRTVVKIKDEKSDKKLVRYQKIVMEASEQCLRTCIPTVEECITLKQIKEYKSDINLIAYASERLVAKRISEVIKPGCSVSIAIGPEGGFSKEEVDKFMAEGFIPVSLGKRILRAETAVAYSLSVINELGDQHD
ncbi:MAG: 16S rRNA (uracil(1498)-N(3))-methyltransferase [Erysipelotrichaceae bacterium]|nr:16S rRNA (uracil(1498)-N(3))-methyltransferase [Erysipelotrichaceae bacterium]